MFTRLTKRAYQAIKTTLRNLRSVVQNSLAKLMTLVGVRKSRGTSVYCEIKLLAAPTTEKSKAEQAKTSMQDALDRKNENNEERSESFDAFHGRRKKRRGRTLRRNSRRNNPKKG